MEIQRINEFRAGRKFSETCGCSVSIFCIIRTSLSTLSCQLAYDVAVLLATARSTVLSSGGSGLTQTANANTRSAGGHSPRIRTALPFEPPGISQQDTSLLSASPSCEIRHPLHCSEAFVTLSGGTGTLDEIFEPPALMQTGNPGHRPVVLSDHPFRIADSSVRTASSIFLS